MKTIYNLALLVLLSSATQAQPNVNLASQYGLEDESSFNQSNPPDEFVLVKGGSFKLGSDDEHSAADESPVKKITLASFYMSKNEITFTSFDEFCEDTERIKPDDAEWGRENRPVINVDWYDAIEYCNWRSQKDGLKSCYKVSKTNKDPENNCPYDHKKWKVECDWTASGYRLPTEAEWEYAARGGESTKNYPYAGFDQLDPISWYAENSNEMTHTVGRKDANELGLFDMSGNVWEWCWDWYGEESYKKNKGSNPKGMKSGKLRVMRGGACDNGSAAYMRVSNRGYLHPGVGYPCLGFRIVRISEDD
ncbi:MAG: formylglycine-generating enzyme family protein [Aureispira sp.]|nr:formylglycine-generating enzyme family protein [Aureispira sp.]